MIGKIERTEFGFRIQANELELWWHMIPTPPLYVEMVIVGLNRGDLSAPRRYQTKLYHEDREEKGTGVFLALQSEFLEAVGLSQGDVLRFRVYKVKKVDD